MVLLESFYSQFVFARRSFLCYLCRCLVSASLPVRFTRSVSRAAKLAWLRQPTPGGSAHPTALPVQQNLFRSREVLFCLRRFMFLPRVRQTKVFKAPTSNQA